MTSSIVTKCYLQYIVYLTKKDNSVGLVLFYYILKWVVSLWLSSEYGR